MLDHAMIGKKNFITTIENELNTTIKFVTDRFLRCVRRTE